MPSQEPSPPDASEKKRCQKHTKKGKPCRQWAIKGLDACRLHAGMKTADAKAKGAKNLALKKVGEMLAEIRSAPADEVNPLDELLGVIAEEAREKALLTDLVGDLETDEDQAKALYGPNHLGDHVPHILKKMLDETRDRLAKHCKMALDAGVAERQVRIAEEQGAQIAQVFIQVIEDPGLDLSRKQKHALKQAGARHLRLLPSA